MTTALQSRRARDMHWKGLAILVAGATTSLFAAAALLGAGWQFPAGPAGVVVLCVVILAVGLDVVALVTLLLAARAGRRDLALAAAQEDENRRLEHARRVRLVSLTPRPVDGSAAVTDAVPGPRRAGENFTVYGPLAGGRRAARGLSSVGAEAPGGGRKP